MAETEKADLGAMQPEGQPEERVLAELEQLAKEDVDWRSGRILTGLYDPGGPAYELTAEAYSRFLTQNALYINMYPSAGRMEQDVVRSLAELLRGDDQVVGNMTSGGTESIMLAVKTARDHAREHRPGVVDPEMVLPITAHPAFHKAAQYLGLRVVVTPVETEGFRADVAAKERGILFHVDACVGGIILPFLRRLGEVSRAFDFTVDGVTSISADMHKYGYAPKNASVLLYRNRELRKHALFVCSGTTEYAVINPTVLSSKTAGPIAAAWAVLRHLGEAGYERIARESWEATRVLVEGIEKIEGIEVLAEPEICMFTLGSEEINIFELDDEMRQRGWSLLPQFACGGGPANLHVSIADSNVPHVDRLLSDLREAVGQILSRGPSVDREAMAREVAAVEDRPLEEIFARLIGLAGLTGEGLPERMAPLNTILDLLPSETRDQILAAYINAI